MKEISGAIQMIVALFGLIGILGGLSGFFRAQRARSIIELQNESINAQEKRLGTLEKEIAALQGDYQLCKDRLITAENTIAVLQDQVTGASAINKLSKVVEDGMSRILEQISSPPVRKAPAKRKKK